MPGAFIGSKRAWLFQQLNLLPNPLATFGPALKFWGRADAGLSTDGAVNLVAASSQSLSVASNSSLQASGVDVWGAVWVNLSSVPTGGIMTKWNTTAATEEYDLYQSTSTLNLAVSNGTSVIQITGVSFSINTWTLLTWYIDTVNGLLGFAVNNGAFTTTAFSGTVPATVSPVTFGNTNGFSQFVNGSIGPAFFGKSPVGGIAGSAAAIRSALWNGGNGLLPNAVTSAQITSWGGISAWPFIQPGNLGQDAWASNTLTLNNAPTYAAGHVVGTPSVTGDAVSAWADQSGTGNTVIQATGSLRPTYVQASGGRNGLPLIRFPNASGYFLNNTSPTGMPSSAAARALFLACKVNSPGTPAVPCAWGTQSSNEAFAIDPSGNATNFAAVRGYFNDYTTTLATDTSWHEWDAQYDGTNVTLYRDGSSSGPSATNYATVIGQLNVGSFVGQSNLSYFDVGEVVLAAAKASPSQQAATRAWLKSRWATP